MSEVKYESFFYGADNYGNCLDKCHVRQEVQFEVKIGSALCQKGCEFSKRKGQPIPEYGWDDVLCSRLTEARGK